jgi:hypothetical protein
LRSPFDDAARLLGLIPPASPGETKLNNLNENPLRSAEERIVHRAPLRPPSSTALSFGD